MTDHPSFGRALGEAARELTRLHRRALADFDCDFPTWMLYTLLRENPPAGEIAREMSVRMDLEQPDTLRLLDRAAAAGHVTYQPGDPTAQATLTEAGAAWFTSVYAHSRAYTDRVVDDIDPATVESAVAVLVAVRERAQLIPTH